MSFSASLSASSSVFLSVCIFVIILAYDDDDKAKFDRVFSTKTANINVKNFISFTNVKAHSE